MVSSQMHVKLGCGSALSENIASLTKILLANLFFVEADDSQCEGMKNLTLTPYQEQRRVCQFRGSIRCRLCFDSAELKSLVHRVGGFYHAELRQGPNIDAEQPQWTQIQ